MFNQFTGIGRLAGEVENRFTQSGTEVASFTVCCDAGYGDNKRTEFVRCTAWSKLAGICGQYLDKGSMVMIQGEVETKSWDDKDGNKRYSTGVTVREMKMLSPKNESNTQESSGGYGTGEDVPF